MDTFDNINITLFVIYNILRDALLIDYHTFIHYKKSKIKINILHTQDCYEQSTLRNYLYHALYNNNLYHKFKTRNVETPCRLQ